jgi:hypothetical protein
VVLVVVITILLSFVPIAFIATMTKSTRFLWLFFINAQVLVVTVDLVNKQATHFRVLFHNIFKVFMAAIAEIKGLVRGSRIRDVSVGVLSRMQANEGSKVLEYCNVFQLVFTWHSMRFETHPPSWS